MYFETFEKLKLYVALYPENLEQITEDEINTIDSEDYRIHLEPSAYSQQKRSIAKSLNQDD